MSVFPFIFGNILPSDINISLSFLAVLKGIAISLIITTLFTLYPLLSLGKILPIQIFRHEDQALFSKDKSFYFINALILTFFTIFVFIEIEEFWFSFWLVAGSIILFLFLYLLTTLILKLIIKCKRLVSNL